MHTRMLGGLRRKPRSDRVTRLDGWKSIAAHLHRTVRTVQRWAIAENLPVHKLQHRSIASVYAFTAELDAWLGDRHQSGATSSTAYLHYVRGRRAASKRTLPDLVHSIRAFNHALDADPVWADGYAALADSYLTLSANEFWPPSDGYRKSRAAADEALRLVPCHPGALTALGCISAFYDGCWARAIEYFDCALRFSPGLGGTHYRRGLVLTNLGRFEEAVSDLRIAAELEPLSAIMAASIGRPFLCMQQWDAALEHFRSALELDPELWVTHVLIGWAEEGRGRYLEAIESMERAVRLPSHNLGVAASIAHSYAKLGDLERAREMISAIVHTGAYVSPIRIARVSCALGDFESALQGLCRACNDRSLWNNTFLPYDVGFAPMSKLTAFERIVDVFRYGDRTASA